MEIFWVTTFVRTFATFIFCICIIPIQAQTAAQQTEQIRAGLEKIQATFSGKPETFDQLITEGRHGLSVADKNDFKNRFTFYQAIGLGYYYKQQFDSASFYLEQAYTEAQKGKLIELSTKPLGSLASIYTYMGKPTKADTAITLLKQILNSTDTLKNKSDIYYNLGLYYQQQKSYYSIALDYFLKSASLHKYKADTTSIPKIKMDYAVKLMMIAEVYLQMKQPDKAIQYLNDANPYLGNSFAIKISCYGKFIRTYGMLNNLSKAKEYYDLLQISMNESPGNWSEAISSNLEMYKLYLHQQNFSLAKNYLDKAQTQALKDKKEIQLNIIRVSYGEYYIALKDYSNALKHLYTAEPSTAKYSKEVHADFLKAITEAQFMSGNFTEAQKNFQLYNYISDSLLKQKINMNIAEMEAIYQNKEKQLQIESKTVELANATRQKIGLLIGLGLVAISALLLSIIYRNKRQTAAALDTKNKELNKLNEELNEANRTKAKLFGIISHDLRSPISQVYQFLKLQQLNPEALNAQQKNELSNKIQNATGSLLETMEDLLLWSKTQMNEFKVNPQPTKLLPVIEACQNVLRLNTDSKNIRYKNLVKENTIINTDPYYLQTIIRNLLQNAIKASSENSQIEMGVEKNDFGFVLFIQNEGASFTQQQYKQIISSEENTRSINGMGLRLVDELSKKIGVTVTFITTNQATTRAEIAIAEKHQLL